MEVFERAWRLAGYTVVVDPAIPCLEVDACPGEVPTLCMSPAHIARHGRDECFALGIMDLSHQGLGFLGLVRRLRAYMAPHELEEAG